MSQTLPSISMTIPALKDERTTSPLPPIGHDISRPPSANHSERRTSPGQENREKVTLPSLSTLTKVAAEGDISHRYGATGIEQRGGDGGVTNPTRTDSPYTHPPNPGPQHSHTYSNASPTPTSVAGQGNVPPVCQNCQTSTTPLWRRDEAGSVLCNACGLFLKLHGRPRPISLKTDVIKSRNRVKSSAQNGRRKMQFSAHQPMPHHHDLSTPPHHPSYRRVSDQHMPVYPDRSASPISRAGTPQSLHPHHTYPSHPHTAPPLTSHLFDPSLARSPSPMPLAIGHHPQSQSAPSTIIHRVASPRPHGPTLPLPVPTVNGPAHSPSIQHSQPPVSTAELQTRISELEVINALYKGQVQDLENARKRDADTIEYLRRENDDLRRAASHAAQHQQQQPQHHHHHHHQPPRPTILEPIATQQPPIPPEPRSEPPVDYATSTGSIKRRRGRTLERAGEDSKPYGSKRRETGEFPRPELAAVRV